LPSDLYCPMVFMICYKLLIVIIKDLIYLTNFFNPIYTTICYTTEQILSCKF